MCHFSGRSSSSRATPAVLTVDSLRGGAQAGCSAPIGCRIVAGSWAGLSPRRTRRPRPPAGPWSVCPGVCGENVSSYWVDCYFFLIEALELDLFSDCRALTAPESLLAGISTVALPTNAFTGGAAEHWYPVVPAWGAAAGVKLLHELIPGSLQVGPSGTNVLGGCAKAHQLINWHHLQRDGTETSAGGSTISESVRQVLPVHHLVLDERRVVLKRSSPAPVGLGIPDGRQAGAAVHDSPFHQSVDVLDLNRVARRLCNFRKKTRIVDKQFAQTRNRRVTKQND